MFPNGKLLLGYVEDNSKEEVWQRVESEHPVLPRRHEAGPVHVGQTHRLYSTQYCLSGSVLNYVLYAEEVNIQTYTYLH